MRRLGLLGGMSWQSSALYYSLVNELVAERLGGVHSADLVMVSVDFAEVERLQAAGDWAAASDLLAREAQGLEAAGAEAIVLCTNTMHLVAPAIEEAVSIPLLHLADVTARAVSAAGLDRVGMLGTRFTMQQPFLRDRIASHGLDVLVPEPDDQEVVHRVIYEELVRGVVSEQSRAEYLRIIDRLVAQGAQGIVLGCTEIEMLIEQHHVARPLFPTTRLHAEAAVEWALAP
ncbi:MAG: aspartate/glutamate racemase family protein [Actinobacteria bacterium]|nr:aspartate/glutamate racemase family protein [Actinomycetota bacterium]MBU1610023.1 aspartate/glutamate racemase family protein [Actinomycetota bacterium]MBU2315609.1 aspartate/glutamate racemase family protein [Actinomycetota bacterium]MBU2384498.1 aspartate/glutamate racemase family protein [Actinomycetota bacterium]